MVSMVLATFAVLLLLSQLSLVPNVIALGLLLILFYPQCNSKAICKRNLFLLPLHV